MNPPLVISNQVEPLCTVFRQCGGCMYQDIDYDRELEIKDRYLRDLFAEHFGADVLQVFEPIVPSPLPYGYRHRLDLTLKRTREEGVLFGFQSPASRKMVYVEACPIARTEVSSFLPELREKSLAILPEKYRTANLVVKTSDDGRVVWGGIGRKSLEMKPEDYLWTEILGKRIFFALDSFFQANLSILPRLMEKISGLAQLDERTCFLDLYAGVGLFGIYFAEQAAKVIMIESAEPSLALMRYNAAYHKLGDKVQILVDRVESVLPMVLESVEEHRKVALIDPPRRGLHESARETLAGAIALDQLFYLSCHPESLIRDLQSFVEKGWAVERVVPFDFFPKTQHQETLVALRPPCR